MIKYTLILLFFGILFSCKNSHEKHAEISLEGEDYLNESRAILDSLINTRNAEAIANLFSENAVCSFENMDELSGRENIKNAFQKIFDRNDTLHIVSKVSEIMAQGQWALERSIYSYVYRRKDSVNLQYISGRMLTYFNKRNNHWEITWQFSNVSPIANMDSVFKQTKSIY